VTSYIDQIIIDLVKDNLWSSDRVEVERAQLQERIDIASGDIKTAQSKINSLRKEISKLKRKQDDLLKQHDFEENKERIGQKLQTFEGFVEYLPRLRPGRPRKYHEQTFASGINGKQMRDRMIVEELKRRQAKNPERPITSEASQEKTHANDLAEELREAGVPRVGYRTIKNAWRMRDKN